MCRCSSLIKKNFTKFHPWHIHSNLMVFGLCLSTHISSHQILCMTHDFSYFIDVVLNIFGSFIFFYIMLAFTIINCLFFIVDRGLVSPFTIAQVFLGSWEENMLIVISSTIRIFGCNHVVSQVFWSWKGNILVVFFFTIGLFGWNCVVAQVLFLGYEKKTFTTCACCCRKTLKKLGVVGEMGNKGKSPWIFFEPKTKTVNQVVYLYFFSECVFKIY